jgi:hypothetical protein
VDKLAGGLDPINRIASQEKGPLRRTHHQPVSAPYPLPRVQLLEQGQYPAGNSALRSAAVPRRRAAHGLPQPILIDRLQQIIERMDLERPDRILVVRGDEDDRRLMRVAQSSHHLESVEPRHLDVE